MNSEQQGYESKAQYIARRLDYHKAVLKERHHDIPDSALKYWAEQEAEKEYRQGRVYADPVVIQATEISVYDTTQKFAAGKDRGVHLRFNPGGPMVSIMQLSFAELRELVIDAMETLEEEGQTYGLSLVREGTS